MSSRNEKLNSNGKKAPHALPRAPNLPSKPPVKAQPSSHGTSSLASGWAAIAAGRPKDETAKQGISATLRMKKAHLHPQHQPQSQQQVETQNVQHIQQEQQPQQQQQVQILPVKPRESINGFNSDEVKQFLTARSTSYRDTPVYKESGSEWSKPTGFSRSKKEKDVVVVQLSKVIKH
jgi:hypothetical protein